MIQREYCWRSAAWVAALLFAANASANDEFNFASPPANPQGTPVLPGGVVTLQLCAKREWLDTLIGAGALWPGPPYKVNLTWEAKKWNWAPPEKLPTTTLLVTSVGQKICSEPLRVGHADFPVRDLWRVRATVQFDKGVQSGPVERFIRMLPPQLKDAPANQSVAPVQPVPPATRTPRRN